MVERRSVIVKAEALEVRKWDRPSTDLRLVADGRDGPKPSVAGPT
jgi:hypothetical protein